MSFRFYLRVKVYEKAVKHKYLQSKELTVKIIDLPYIFCRLHCYEQIPYDDEIEVDFVIDTDTDRIYSPYY